MKLRDRLRRRRVDDLVAPAGQHPQRDHWLDADPRRQAGDEVIYGTGWIFHDPDDTHSLIWNAGTGELYTHRHRGDTVAVLGTFPTRGDVDALLANWEELHAEPFGGYMVCSRIAAHEAEHRSPATPCYAVVLRVDGTAEPFDGPLTYHDIQIALGGVALTTADEQNPSSDPLAAAWAPTVHVDRNAHRDRKPVNEAATSLYGRRWPIRGDVVITGSDPQVPLSRWTRDMLLRLPRPAEPTAPPSGPRPELATIPRGDWLQADPRRRSEWQTCLWRDSGAYEDHDFAVTFNHGSHELYLLDRRNDTIAELGVFDDIDTAHAVVDDWKRNRVLGDDRPTFGSLRVHAARASILIDRDIDHDLALADHALTAAAEHDFTVRFNAGRHQPVRFRFERTGVGTHLGRAFTVSGPYVEPSSRAGVEAALTDFLDNRSPDKVELDPHWAQAEADYVADGREWMQRQLAGETDPSDLLDGTSLDEAEAHVDTHRATLSADTASGTAPAQRILAQWKAPPSADAGPRPDSGPSPAPPPSIDGPSL